MDPAALAAMVVSAIVPYLAKAGEAVVKEVGTAAWKKTQEIFSKIEAKFKGDKYAVETLKRLKEQPDSTSRQSALTGVLEEKLKEDPSFSDALKAFLDETKESGDSINQQVNLSANARSGDINVVGKVVGDVTIGPKDSGRTGRASNGRRRKD